MKNIVQTIFKTILIVGGVLGILFWLALLFYAFFLGGSPGPGYGRTVSLAYVGVMGAGLFGAVLGLIVLVRGKKGRIGLPQAALLGVIGSVPLFLMELPVPALAALIVGIAPLLGLLPRK